jgi:gentisate 1,2-dioxygenase
MLYCKQTSYDESGCDHYTSNRFFAMRLDKSGMIKNGVRADWAPGASFVTPPGYWHSHHNESGADAHVLPIQDAGLHTYLRTLEITFSHPGHDHTAHISQMP